MALTQGSDYLGRGVVLKALDAAQKGELPRRSGISAQYLDFQSEVGGWINNDRVVGYGYPGKGGYYASDKTTPKIAIYVQSDDDLKTVQEMIPEDLKLPGVSRRIAIEVVNIGEVVPVANLTGRNRPAQPGMSISHLKMPSGTLGAFVRKIGNDQDTFILSCNHVLTEFCQANVGDAIIQPGSSDRGKASDQIAELFEAVALKFHDREYENIVDAAIAKVTDSADIRDEIAFLGRCTGVSSSIQRSMTVTKCGRTSAQTQGKVLDTSARLRLRYPRQKNSTSLVGFRDVVLCTHFSREGDSGALVLNPSKQAVGMVMAGSSRMTAFCKMANICNELRIELLSGPI